MLKSYKVLNPSRLLNQDSSQLTRKFLKKPSTIKNKFIRTQMAQKERAAKDRLSQARRKHRIKLRKTLGSELIPEYVPHTTDNRREENDNVVNPDDQEDTADLQQDEFSDYFDQKYEPKILITTCYRPTRHLYKMVNELLSLIPNSNLFKREKLPVNHIINYANQNKYTGLFVANEHKKKPSGLLYVHLPSGPTAYFKVSNFIPNKKLKNHGVFSKEYPELVLTNFTTRLGQTVGRMLLSIFPQQPEFYGRRVVSFINHRDYIFFRHHRYIFSNLAAQSKKQNEILAEQQAIEEQQDQIETFVADEDDLSENPSKLDQDEPEKEQFDDSSADDGSDTEEDEDGEDGEEDEDIDNSGEEEEEDFADFGDDDDENYTPKPKPKVILQEVGPQFTLKLRWIQKGLFDPIHGEFIWKHSSRLDSKRKKFYL